MGSTSDVWGEVNTNGDIEEDDSTLWDTGDLWNPYDVYDGIYNPDVVNENPLTDATVDTPVNIDSAVRDQDSSAIFNRAPSGNKWNN